MTYAAPADLIARVSAQDVAEAAAPDERLDGDVLTALVRDQSLAGFDPDDVATARAIVTGLNDYLATASATINGYIATRYPDLITSPQPANADLLRGLCVNLVLWALLGGDPDSERRKNYDAAMMQLKAISTGQMTLTCPNGDPDESGAMAHSDKQQFRTGVSW